MPLVILDGPEAAGKSTIIDALISEWGPESSLRHNGPKDSWLEYCQPLYDDLKICQHNPTYLKIWSRGWGSRTVYNKLLQQNQIVPPEVTRELDEIVFRSGGGLYMVTASEKTLLERRLKRISEGSPQNDHQLDVGQELAEFQRYARNRRWKTLAGTLYPVANARSIITDLVQRNPECRMRIEENALSE